MLQVSGLQAAYGDSQILFGVDLSVEAGEVVTLLGRNGMGKTTTIKSIMGLLRPRAGEVRFDGVALAGKPPHAIAQRGIGLVPEGRQVFPTLSVEENLIATSAARFGKPRWTLDSVYGLFPRPEGAARQHGQPALGRRAADAGHRPALMTNPRLTILDEATEGLAPLIRQEIWDCLKLLKREGEAILVIDKNVDALATFADRHVILEKGRVAWSGTTAALLADPVLKDRYLHV